MMLVVASYLVALNCLNLHKVRHSGISGLQCNAVKLAHFF